MSKLKSELNFLCALMALNLASATEYRASFLTQVIGMFVNTGIYFVFWLIFFQRFGDVRGYQIDDIYLLFGVVALSFGLATVLAGNVGTFLAQAIAQGRLDYYLALPRNVLSHVIFSRMAVYSIGDILFGLCAFLLFGRYDPTTLFLFLTTATLAAMVYAGFAIIAGSLAFFMGNAVQASGQMTNAVITFALYPHTLFAGTARFLLYTLLPAGFIGAMPVEIIKNHNVARLPVMIAAVTVVWFIAIAVFHIGLRRYESGSALNVNL